jgi:hypothetical protein
VKARVSLEQNSDEHTVVHADGEPERLLSGENDPLQQTQAHQFGSNNNTNTHSNPTSNFLHANYYSPDHTASNSGATSFLAVSPRVQPRFGGARQRKTSVNVGNLGDFSPAMLEEKSDADFFMDNEDEDMI